MSRAILIAECATAHGGDLSIAEEMIAAAADSGADYVKFQSYALDRLNPSDPQAEWLRQAYLNRAAHERLMGCCLARGIEFLSTPFDVDSLGMLRELGLATFKIASSESGSDWWEAKPNEQWFVSYPWGVVPERRVSTYTFRGAPIPHDDRSCVKLTAIPLYPTSLECVGRATILDGWSDHCEDLSACYWALARGVNVIEIHLCIPGRTRVMKFDKTPQNLKELRDFADKMRTIHAGVSTQFLERWNGSR